MYVEKKYTNHTVSYVCRASVWINIDEIDTKGGKVFPALKRKFAVRPVGSQHDIFYCPHGPEPTTNTQWRGSIPVCFRKQPLIAAAPAPGLFVHVCFDNRSSRASRLVFALSFWISRLSFLAGMGMLPVMCPQKYSALDYKPQADGFNGHRKSWPTTHPISTHTHIAGVSYIFLQSELFRQYWSNNKHYW